MGTTSGATTGGTGASLTRRRLIGISAAAAGLALLPPGAGAAGPALHRWRGAALGAEATIQLHHPDAAEAGRLIRACVDEIGRLERVFSLYRADSAVSALNAAGALDAPPLDLVRLLGDCARFSELTGGAFDATVQPLWRCYADHFSKPGADPAGPDPATARALVDWRAVRVDPARISLRPGMAVTLNGIAQGYITDRITGLLRGSGVEHVLVDLGEIRALGGHPSGRPWAVGIADPSGGDGLERVLDLADMAVATSGGYGSPFDPAGRHTHLIDPRTGRSVPGILGVSVVAPEATTADALSTAFSLMTPGETRRAMARLQGVTLYRTTPAGTEILYA